MFFFGLLWIINQHNTFILFLFLFNSCRYNRANRPDRALEYYLRLKKPNVFILIREYGLFAAVQEKALLLMEFDQYLYDLRKKAREEARARAAEGDAAKDVSEDQTPESADDELSKGLAVQLLVEHTDEIPVSVFPSTCSRGGRAKSPR